MDTKEQNEIMALAGLGHRFDFFGCICGKDLDPFETHGDFSVNASPWGVWPWF